MDMTGKIVVVLSGDAFLEYLGPDSSKFADENVVVVVPTSSLNYALTSKDFVAMDIYKEIIEAARINILEFGRFSEVFVGEEGDCMVFFNDHYNKNRLIPSDIACRPYTREDLAAIMPAQWDDLFIAAVMQIQTRCGNITAALYIAVSGNRHSNASNASLIVYAQAWHDLEIKFLSDVCSEITEGALKKELSGQEDSGKRPV